jgi:hypothetical protein
MKSDHLAGPCENLVPVWRVVFRSWGNDEEEWYQFDEAQEALEVSTGIRDADAHGLLQYVNLERWDGERWVSAE